MGLNLFTYHIQGTSKEVLKIPKGPREAFGFSATVR